MDRVLSPSIETFMTKPTPLCRYQPWPCSSMTWVVDSEGNKLEITWYENT